LIGWWYGCRTTLVKKAIGMAIGMAIVMVIS
jgi:hypothetical protein